MCLINAGSDVNIANKNGWTALHYPAANGVTACCSLLLNAGADVNLSNNNGWTALHLAAANGATDGCSLLVNAGAGVNVSNKNGNNPLHEYLINTPNPTSEIVNCLIKDNAILASQNKNGNNPLHEYLITTPNPTSEIVNCLIKDNAILASQNKEGNTALHIYLSRGYNEPTLEIVTCLIKNCSLTILQNKKGETPESMVKNNVDSTFQSEKIKILKYFDKLVPAEIFGKGKDAIKIYKEELASGKISVVNSRCMFLGKEGAGKTSCVKAMVGESFNSKEPSTDGIVTTTVFQSTKKDSRKWKKIKNVNDMEISKQAHSSAIEKKIDQRLEKEGSVGIWDKIKNATYKRMVVGNKNVSDITSIWDYAGQLEYYITHRFFLTNTVSYCVAFNVMDKLDEQANPRDSSKGQLGMTNLDMNLFWIRSIYEHTVSQHGSGNTISIDGKNIESPPICLVATHVDKLPGTASEKEEEVMKMYKKMFDKMEGMPYAHHVDREMYMVDNTMKSHEGITKLRRNVGRYMKEMVREVPVKWVNLQERLQRIGETELCVTFEEVSGIGTECGISKERLAIAIEYMNDIGIILYSSTNKKLKNTVITDLKMMIQMVTKVITVVKPSIKVKQISVLWKRLDEEGILEERLLRYLWKQELKEDPHRFEIFTEVMKTFGLLFEKSEVPESNRVFLVPSRMQTKKESLEVKMDEENMVSIYLTPTDFLPNAVYNTLVVAFLDLMEVKGRPGEPVVFQNCSEFDFKDHGVNLGTVKIENRHALKLEISHLIKVDGNTTGPKNEPHRSFCIEVLGYLKHQLQNVLVTSETVGYNLCVLCTACNPAEKPHLHGLKRCLEQDFDGVKCGDKLMDTTRLKNLFSEDTPDATTTPLAISSLLPSGQLIDTPDATTTTPVAISSSLPSGQLIDTPDDTTTPLASSSLPSGQLIDTPDDTTTPLAISSLLPSGQLIDTPDATTTPLAISSSLPSGQLIDTPDDTTTPLAISSSLPSDTPDATTTPLAISSSLPSGQLIDTPDDTTTPLAISSSLPSGQLIDTPDATTTPVAISSSLPSGQLIDTPDDTTTPLAISSSLPSGQLIDTPDDTTTPLAISSSLPSGQLIDTPDDTTTPLAISSSLPSGQLIDTPDATTTTLAISSSLPSGQLIDTPDATTTPVAISSSKPFLDTQTATPLSTSSLETDAPIAAPLAASSLGTSIGE
ncbi:uncharacterized protein [Antedon mediterranea]|uniref:uncharacterized protein n=1 Tax=Antedon mediterranea TaxID=105859 RepID=UPI003AF6D46B